MASVLLENSKFRRFREASLQGWMMELGVNHDELVWYRRIEQPKNGFDPVKPCMFPSSNWNDNMWPQQTQFPAMAKLSLGRAKQTFLLEDNDVSDLCYLLYQPKYGEHMAHLYLNTQLERRAWEKYGGPQGFREAQAAKNTNYQDSETYPDTYLGEFSHDPFVLQAILAMKWGQNYHPAYHVDGAPLQTSGLSPSNKTQQNITPSSSTTISSTPSHSSQKRKRHASVSDDDKITAVSYSPQKRLKSSFPQKIDASSEPDYDFTTAPSEGRMKCSFEDDDDDDDDNVTVVASSPLKLAMSPSPQECHKLSLGTLKNEEIEITLNSN